jgi:hypothetical protein
VLATVWLQSALTTTAITATIEMKPQVRPCGDEENRTLNPRLAKAVLCQLSYVPWRSGPATRGGTDTIMRPIGLGPES